VSLRPGTFVSFVAHDLRLGARGFAGMFGALPARRVAAILVAALVGLHLVAWPAALWFGGHESGADGDRFLTAAMRSGVFFVLPWVVASAMTAVTRMLYQRGDLDLLFASPIFPRDALAARLFAQAIEAVASVGLLLLPLADACALQGRPHWLALYPALFACGLFGAGLGLMLALALFFAVGPRRARAISQIGATLVGASAVLGAQIVAMLPNAARTWLFDALACNSDGDALRRLATLPERAAGGEPAALVGWMALALAMFVAAVLVFGGGFARAACNRPELRRRRGAHGRERGFAPGSDRRCGSRSIACSGAIPGSSPRSCCRFSIPFRSGAGLSHMSKEIIPELFVPRR
jgi:ABC-2 type transport system permease protein